MQWGEEWGVPGEQEHGVLSPPGDAGTWRALYGQDCVSRQVVGGLVEEEGLTILDLSTSYYSSKLPLMAC